MKQTSLFLFFLLITCGGAESESIVVQDSSNDTAQESTITTDDDTTTNTTQETTTATPNIRYNASKSLNNMMTIGETVTVTIIYKPLHFKTIFFGPINFIILIISSNIVSVGIPNIHINFNVYII